MSRTIAANETDLWLIPKRGSIHQVWCLIDGIIERKVDGRTWGPSMQNNLGVNLKNWGATRDGRNISPQGIRTLTAFAQYLGFVYIDSTTTPSVIRITRAGYKFWEDHRSSISKLRNLVLDSNLEMSTSDDVTLQMEKLQLTNPIQQKKCTNILLFPFRMTLKLLQELDYLDTQELAIFLFPMQAEDDYSFVLLSIRNFRRRTIKDREAYVEAYKGTKLGNITLVQAPSTGYYITLCERTGLVESDREHPLNWTSSKLSTLRIKQDKATYVSTILKKTYLGIEPYDFKEDVRLWIEYFGDPDQIFTPIDATVFNKSGSELFVTVLDNNKNTLASEILEDNEQLLFPAFPSSEYTISIFNTALGKFLKDVKTIPSANKYSFVIDHSITPATTHKGFNEIKQEILDHVSAANFSPEILKLLNAIKIVNSVDKTSDPALRGAYLEFLFYKLLSCHKSIGIIDDVIWNGHIGQYGLPNAAPGGKAGKCDILFYIDNKQFVLELTTIKSKSGQEKAEATAVPDHVRIARDDYSTGDTIGIYSAPIIHNRVTSMMKATADSHGVRLNCIDVSSLLTLLSATSKSELLKALTR